MAREGGSECTVGTRVGATVGEGGGERELGGVHAGGRAGRRGTMPTPMTTATSAFSCAPSGRARRRRRRESGRRPRRLTRNETRGRSSRSSEAQSCGGSARSAPRTRAQRRAHAVGPAHAGTTHSPTMSNDPRYFSQGRGSGRRRTGATRDLVSPPAADVPPTGICSRKRGTQGRSKARPTWGARFGVGRRGAALGWAGLGWAERLLHPLAGCLFSERSSTQSG